MIDTSIKSEKETGVDEPRLLPPLDITYNWLASMLAWYQMWKVQGSEAVPTTFTSLVETFCLLHLSNRIRRSRDLVCDAFHSFQSSQPEAHRYCLARLNHSGPQLVLMGLRTYP